MAKSHYVRIFSGLLLTMLLTLTTVAFSQPDADETWQEVLKNKKGVLTVYWHESKPFIFKTEQGTMRGIEVEIVYGFVEYLRKSHHVTLKVNWIDAIDFANIKTIIKNKKTGGVLGMSAMSITPERAAEVGFSPPYMADISVMVASKNIPVAEKAEDLNKVYSTLTAYTIKGTTYEDELLKLKQNGATFNIEYIPSKMSIIEKIVQTDNAFGFEDLPVYMMMYSANPSIKVNRQNFLPIKRKGYAFIYPPESDWAAPVAEYFNNPDFKPALEKIIAHYFNIELYHFIESLAIQTNDPILLLTKEKELQERSLSGVSQQLLYETRVRNFLIGFAIVITLFLVIIFSLYQKSNQQKKEIENQQKNIEMKSHQLENRNVHLVAVNEEKNNLIRILAHDLRTPINHVQGLAQIFLLSNPSLDEEQKSIIQQITDAAQRLTKMITNILDIDAVENNRVRLIMDEVDLVPLVHQVVKSFEKIAAKKNISLQFSSSKENFRINADSLFLIQVLENLISNAIKFSSHDKSVEITLSEKSTDVVISVADHGPGVTEEELDLVFKKFQRLSNRPTGGESSTGLGLSIVKTYVELMQGSVWCDSKPGQGSVFLVSFKQL